MPHSHRPGRLQPLREPTCTKLVEGTTPRLISHVLPEIKSTFNLQTWHECLHHIQMLILELIYCTTMNLEYALVINPRFSLSARTHPAPVAHEIERELDLNRKVGLFLAPPFQHFTGSPLGANPKKHSAPVKWRLIHDLSWPVSLSIKNGIPKGLFLCTYDLLNQAITILKHFGLDALMSKLDLSDAFRHVLVHDGDWVLLASTWPMEIDCTVVTGYFFDIFLPFGLQSSPVLFLKFVNRLKFVMSSKGVLPVWNYLDNFWTCGPPSQAQHCQNSLDVMLRTCDELGFKYNS